MEQIPENVVAEAPPSPSDRAQAVMSVLALAAFCVSVFLFWVALAGRATPGCAPSAWIDCDSVLASKWSKWFNLPVSVLSIAAYAAILASLPSLSQRAAPARRAAARCMLLALAIIVVGAALWFIGLQVFLLGKFCSWCMLAHACGLVLGTMLLRASLHSSTPGSWGSIVAAPARHYALFAVAALALLIVGQYFSRSADLLLQTRLGGGPNIDTGPGPDRQISVLGGGVRLGPHHYPILGSGDAPHIIVYLFDYTCPHCRTLHQSLNLARQRYGDALAIITLPVPMDAECNKLVEKTKIVHESACAMAKLALAVWRAAPREYEAFDAWMFQTPTPRPVAEVSRRAAEVLGSEVALAAALADPWIQEQIERDIKFYEIVAREINYASIPQLVMGNQVIVGQPREPHELFKLLEDETGLVPRHPEIGMPEKETKPPAVVAESR